jgi:hypothetical protein
MSRGKTGLIVLTFLAVFFFLFIAVLFGSSTKRQAALDRKTDLESKLDSIAGEDITIYWIGEPSPELEHLMPVINVITPGTASKDNLPVKSPSFHTSEYNPDGILIEEKIPVEYPEYMVIVISGSPELTDNGKAALLDAVAQNGVPALAIGDEASELLGEVLSYRRVHKGEGSSLYYCLGKGYRENPIPEDKVKSGEMDLAETIPDLITLAMSDYTPQI